ncbi:MAG: alpha-L-fucosidase [Chthoniobacterales bacterium]
MRWKHVQLGVTDNGSNPVDVLARAFTTDEANQFFLNQMMELLTTYGEIFEVWMDIPGVVGRAFRQRLYWEIARLQPAAYIMMNNGFGDGTGYPVEYAWPADLMAIERWLPNGTAPFNPWREIEGKKVYLPGEVCDPIGREWFFKEEDHPRCDRELLGMYLTCRARNTNLLLNVPPDRTGRLPDNYVQSLLRLRKNFGLLSFMG